MVFADEVFYIHGPPTYLLPVHVANQRLLADRIFLAHAASLRRLLFCKMEIQRVFSQLQSILTRTAFPSRSFLWLENQFLECY
jgi:hypothetical protein